MVGISNLTKLRVIVAEDHEEMLEALVCILKDEFDIVGAVPNGRDLVDAALALHPDVIVTDIFMPVLTGPQAMQELSAQGQNIPSVFVSSYQELIVQSTWSLVSKTDVFSELVPAVHAVASGKRYISRKFRPRNHPEL